jgi:hypothetical protein
MGVPTSEVGYTSATTGRGDHKVHKGHVVSHCYLGGEAVDVTLTEHNRTVYRLITMLYQMSNH